MKEDPIIEAIVTVKVNGKAYSSPKPVVVQAADFNGLRLGLFVLARQAMHTAITRGRAGSDETIEKLDGLIPRAEVVAKLIDEADAS